MQRACSLGISTFVMLMGLAGCSGQETSGTVEEELSFAEYEATILSTISCLESQGVQVDGPERVQRWGATFLEYTYGGASTLEGLDEIHDLHQECESEHGEAAETWASQNRPTEQQLAEGRVLTRECLIERGVTDLPDPLTRADLEALVQDASMVERVIRCERESEISID